MFLALVYLLASNPAFAIDSLHLPTQTQQVVIVETDSWTSNTGQLQMFSRSSSGWVPVGDKIPVSLGRNGLAWGRGLERPAGDGPQKMEGDGKAPAGIFSLGTAFGYEPQPPPGLKLPYRAITEKDFFVDDPGSPDYNEWVTLDQKSTPRWKSAEKMKRPDYLYQLGIVVIQNTDPVVPDKGSAIFLHIWRQPGTPTAGCTAMARDNLLNLLEWLDPAKHPLLIQVPRGELDQLKLAAPKDIAGGF